ncbi:MAG: hypothetical protein R3E79_45650 [Caldilineaceae bacterium]
MQPVLSKLRTRRSTGRVGQDGIVNLADATYAVQQNLVMYDPTTVTITVGQLHD